MFVRRALFHWMIPAAAVLPTWLLVGWGVFGGSGWAFVFLIVACIALAVFLLVVAGLIRAKRSVREARAVGWWDAAALSAWHLSLIGLGFFGATTGLFLLLSIALGITAFWYALWSMVREAGKRVRATLNAMQAPPVAPRPPQPPVDGGEYIVVREKS